MVIVQRSRNRKRRGKPKGAGGHKRNKKKRTPKNLITQGDRPAESKKKKGPSEQAHNTGNQLGNVTIKAKTKENRKYTRHGGPRKAWTRSQKKRPQKSMPGGHPPKSPLSRQEGEGAPNGVKSEGRKCKTSCRRSREDATNRLLTKQQRERKRKRTTIKNEHRIPSEKPVQDAHCSGRGKESGKERQHPGGWQMTRAWFETQGRWGPQTFFAGSRA